MRYFLSPLSAITPQKHIILPCAAVRNLGGRPLWAKEAAAARAVPAKISGTVGDAQRRRPAAGVHIAGNLIRIRAGKCDKMQGASSIPVPEFRQQNGCHARRAIPHHAMQRNTAILPNRMARRRSALTARMRLCATSGGLRRGRRRSGRWSSAGCPRPPAPDAAPS